MMNAPQLWLVGCSHHETSLAEREQLAMKAENFTAEAQRELQAALQAQELFTLATCNRLEFYAVGQPPQGRSALDWFSEVLPAGINRQIFGDHAFAKTDSEAAEHLFEVAAGVDSQMVGETEITGQVKAAYQRADGAGLIGRTLHRLLQKALQAAKWARTETNIGKGQVSIGNIAAELAERVCGNLPETSILLVGTGEVGKSITQALFSRGARRLTICGRNLERAQGLAEDFAGAAVLPFSHRQEALELVDVVISCTGSPEPVLRAPALKAARKRSQERPLFMIDLAVPRDIEPGIADWETFYLYNMDDLAKIANRNLANRQDAVKRAQTGLRERALRAWSSADPSLGKTASPSLPEGSDKSSHQTSLPTADGVSRSF